MTEIAIYDGNSLTNTLYTDIENTNYIACIIQAAVKYYKVIQETAELADILKVSKDISDTANPSSSIDYVVLIQIRESQESYSKIIEAFYKCTIGTPYKTTSRFSNTPRSKKRINL